MLDTSPNPISEISIGHPNLLHTIEKINESISSPDIEQISLVLGPTGVGKSFLAEQFSAKIRLMAAKEMATDSQHIPVIHYTVRLATDSGFSWKSFYSGLLRELRVPFPSDNVNTARDKIAEVVADRRIRVIFIDEIQHLVQQKNELAAAGQSEVLKSLAQQSKVKFVGLGTYDATKLIRGNGQLSRRTQPIHFCRYRQTPEDIEAFTEILKYYDEKLAGKIEVSLAEQTDYIYKGCVGIVGILSSWLTRARINANLAGDTLITGSSLADSIMPIQDRTRILLEAKIGEAKLIPTEIDEEAYARMLNEDFAQKEPDGMMNEPSISKEKERRVGEPKATRGSLGKN